VSGAVAAAEFRVATPADMKAFGRRLAGLLRAGDLVLLSGPLGAGKTTLVQGIGEGLGVRGPVTSPTFVIARVHPSLSGGPGLVHADAYRLSGPAEVDDLDLDASLARSVTVVEWGGGLADGLAADRLEITITLAPAGSDTAGSDTAGSDTAGSEAAQSGAAAAGGTKSGTVAGGTEGAAGAGGAEGGAGAGGAEGAAWGGDAGEDSVAEPRTVRVARLGQRWAIATESAFLARLTGSQAV
jgi:tRNA threonylcarbamoyladenosine biosynthesis protein TsaE